MAGHSDEPQTPSLTALLPVADFILLFSFPAFKKPLNICPDQRQKNNFQCGSLS